MACGDFTWRSLAPYPASRFCTLNHFPARFVTYQRESRVGRAVAGEGPRHHGRARFLAGRSTAFRRRLLMIMVMGVEAKGNHAAESVYLEKLGEELGHCGLEA